MKLRSLALGALPLLTLAACGDDTPAFNFGDGFSTDTTDTTDTTGDVNVDGVDTDAADVDPDVVPATCGDGVIEGGEQCEGEDLAGATCELRGFAGGTLSCGADCMFDTTACEGECTPLCVGRECGTDPLCGQSCGTCEGDNVCDTNGRCNPPVIEPVCGNGAIEAGELCDGASVGEATCEGLGFDRGTLTCGADCGSYDFSTCESDVPIEAVCGNGTREPGEVCDGTSVGDISCVDYGFDGGVLGCGPACDRHVLVGCTNDSPGPICGNGAVEAGESCDPPDYVGATCQTLGYDRGALRCSNDCRSLDTAGCESDCTPICTGRACGADPVCGITCGVCPDGSVCDAAGQCQTVCGNGAIDAGETCDGTNLGGAACNTLGFTGGELRCNADCEGYNTAACTSTCTPNCAGRTCGPDPVCGISCGTCTDGTCTAAGTCESSAGNAPRFIRFATNVRDITRGESVLFTAVVTDPDGIDDLIGGALLDPITGSTYGAFATSAAEGSYELTLTWDAMHRVNPINFPAAIDREFEAEFFDVDGNRASQRITVTLTCDGIGACDGVCTDLRTTDNCAECGLECVPGASCSAGRCVCPAGQAVCDGVCTDLSTLENCGGCGNTCGEGGSCIGGTCQCGPGTVDCGTSCQPEVVLSSCGDVCGACTAGDVRLLAEGNVLQYYNGTRWGGICDDAFSTIDGDVLCRQMGSTFLSFSSVNYPADDFLVDDLACPADGTSILECSFSPTDNCNASEHVSLFCESAPLCTLPAATVLINEIHFNPAGADGTGASEFVELITEPFVDLSAVELQLIDGATSFQYGTIAITGAADANGYYVLGGASVAGVDQVFTGPIQNGTDYVRIEACDTVLDAVGYAASDTFNQFGLGNIAIVGTDGQSLGRDPFAANLNDNATDFTPATPTPGAPNAGSSCDELVFPFSYTGSLTTSDLTWLRPDESCLGGGVTGTFYYDLVTFTNTTSCPFLLSFSALYTDDGYLMVYNDGFSSAAPTTNCLGGNDDGSGTGDSVVSDITVAAGETVYVVITTYTAGDTLSWDLEINGIAAP